MAVSLAIFTFTQSYAQNRVVTVPADTDYTIKERGANQRVWQRETYQRAPNGRIETQLHSYAELTTGMHYKNDQGDWIESKEEIEAYPKGAIARQGQYQVIFADNINSYGSIDLQTPDKMRLRSHILGLMYHDTASDDAVMIARVQDAKGELIAKNQVLFENAFDGVKGSVRYTYQRGSFEQDVILLEQPPAPAAFGMNPDTTELEVVTEFVDSPKEKLSVRQMKTANSAGQLKDEDVIWGAMRLGRGKVFELGQDPASAGMTSRKEYLSFNGRKVLLEKVKLPDVEAGLSKLPKQAGNLKSNATKMAYAKFVWPESPAVSSNASPMQMSSRQPVGQGFVLDYVVLNTDDSDFTFQGDITYLISGVVNFSGSVTLEGGTVIKYDTLEPYSSIQLWCPVVCKTSAYRPAILTYCNDDTVGESTYEWGATYPGYSYFTIDGPSVGEAVTLQHLRICYAG